MLLAFVRDCSSPLGMVVFLSASKVLERMCWQDQPPDAFLKPPQHPTLSIFCAKSHFTINRSLPSTASIGITALSNFSPLNFSQSKNCDSHFLLNSSGMGVSQSGVARIVSRRRYLASATPLRKTPTRDWISYGRTLKTHIEAVYKGKTPHKCSICDYTCSVKGNLKKHIKSVH